MVAVSWALLLGHLISLPLPAGSGTSPRGACAWADSFLVQLLFETTKGHLQVSLIWLVGLHLRCLIHWAETSGARLPFEPGWLEEGPPPARTPHSSGHFKVNRAASQLVWHWDRLGGAQPGFWEPGVRLPRPAACTSRASWAVWGVGTQLEFTGWRRCVWGCCSLNHFFFFLSKLGSCWARFAAPVYRFAFRVHFSSCFQFPPRPASLTASCPCLFLHCWSHWEQSLSPEEWSPANAARLGHFWSPSRAQICRLCRAGAKAESWKAAEKQTH